MNRVSRITKHIAKMKHNKITRGYQYLLFIQITLLNLPAFAEFRRAQTMLSKVQTGLTGLSLVTVTIAVIWVGYRVLFGGSTIRECAPIIIRAVIIASAAEIAKLLVG